MTKVRITVSDWTYRAVTGLEVLSINADYFRLRRPLERRLYEIARKHVGEQTHPFVIRMSNLQKKVGSNSPPKKFRFFLKEIASDGHIPDYDIHLEGPNVVFTRRDRSNRRPRSLRAKSANGASRIGSRERPGETPPLPLLAAALRIAPDTMVKAKQFAPGYDVYALYEDWKYFASEQEQLPRNPDAAFLGFCKKRHERAPQV